MSIAMWTELQELKSRMQALEQRLGVPVPTPVALEQLLARLSQLENTLEKQRQGKR